MYIIKNTLLLVRAGEGGGEGVSADATWGKNIKEIRVGRWDTRRRKSTEGIKRTVKVNKFTNRGG
jgi:hypothetical protein